MFSDLGNDKTFQKIITITIKIKGITRQHNHVTLLLIYTTITKVIVGFSFYSILQSSKLLIILFILQLYSIVDKYAGVYKSSK